MQQDKARRQLQRKGYMRVAILPVAFRRCCQPADPFVDIVSELPLLQHRHIEVEKDSLATHFDPWQPAGLRVRNRRLGGRSVATRRVDPCEPGQDTYLAQPCHADKLVQKTTK